MKQNITRIMITRDTVKTLLEGYVAGAFKAPHELKEFTIHRTGGIELSVVPVVETLPLDEVDPAEGFGEAAK